MQTSPLILASSSPRRRDLLAEAGFVFSAISPRVREKFHVDLTVRELTVWNAVRKGLWAARYHPNAIVLAADTLVALDHEILGKPANLKEAAQFLRRLSGRVHQVCSGVFMCHLARGRSTIIAEISHVRFRPLDAAKIDKYFSRINPLDKAGAYAAQGHDAEIISQVEGSFSNVVGLPMERTIAALREFGIKPKPP
ncbi:MAG: Maf family protein [Spartobacteria bacterium]